MPRLHRWRNFKLTLLRSRSDGDGLGLVHASGKSGALGRGLSWHLGHENKMLNTDRIHTTIDSAVVAGNAEFKSP
jgi:hypothetical protein